MVFYFNIFEYIMYEFSAAITPVFSVTWSFRNPYLLKNHFLVVSMLKSVVLQKQL